MQSNSCGFFTVRKISTRNWERLSPDYSRNGQRFSKHERGKGLAAILPKAPRKLAATR
jgi:hypothetical protein